MATGTATLDFGTPQQLAPDVRLSDNDNWTVPDPVITDIDDDPLVGDTLGWNNFSGLSATARVSFPSPASRPVGLQAFRFRLLGLVLGGIPVRVEVSLFNAGVNLGRIGSILLPDDSIGRVYNFFWDASLLGTADGSEVECEFSFIMMNAGQGRIDAVAWMVSIPPTDEASVVVSGQSGLTSSSFIEAFWMKETTADNGVDEHEEGGALCPLVCEFIDSTSFRIIAQPTAMYGMGQFKVRWVTA